MSDLVTYRIAGSGGLVRIVTCRPEQILAIKSHISHVYCSSPTCRGSLPTWVIRRKKPHHVREEKRCTHAGGFHSVEQLQKIVARESLSGAIAAKRDACRLHWCKRFWRRRRGCLQHYRHSGTDARSFPREAILDQRPACSIDAQLPVAKPVSPHDAVRPALHAGRYPSIMSFAPASARRTAHQQEARNREHEGKKRTDAELALVLVPAPALTGQVVHLQAGEQERDARKGLKAKHDALSAVGVQIERTGPQPTIDANACMRLTPTMLRRSQVVGENSTITRAAVERASVVIANVRSSHQVAPRSGSAFSFVHLPCLSRPTHWIGAVLALRAVSGASLRRQSRSIDRAAALIGRLFGRRFSCRSWIGCTVLRPGQISVFIRFVDHVSSSVHGGNSALDSWFGSTSCATASSKSASQVGPWVSGGDAHRWAASLSSRPCSPSLGEVRGQREALHDYGYSGGSAQSSKSAKRKFGFQGRHD